MSISKQAPELLMPAGNLQKAKAALAYGADAVYAGVPLFSLRARENEFNVESLAELIRHAHALGRKVYFTMNIYAHNSKVRRFVDAFCEMSDLGPDGFIMTDPGLISQALKVRPQTVVHLSTQANVTNWATAEFWARLGVRRLILSRELSLKEIAEIHQVIPDVELEAFVHGAICIAYSGRCLISNYLTHRDANQGTCTNSCRWEYKLAHDKGSLLQVEEGRGVLEEEFEESYRPVEGTYYLERPEVPGQRYELDEDAHGTYMMNSKDLCAIELLQELRDAGVMSFKVEGRTKSVYYASMVARAYRSAIDDMVTGKSFNPENLREVMAASSRTLMTGFLLKRPEEYGENFEDGASRALYRRFGGVVENYDAGSSIAWVQVKNPVKIGDDVEWVTPDRVALARVERIVDEKGEERESAHGGTLRGFNCPVEADEFTILRAFVPETQIPDEGGLTDAGSDGSSENFPSSENLVQIGVGQA